MMTVNRAKNGSLRLTAERKDEPAALRCMIELELRGWTVYRCTKLGDGTYLIQAGGSDLLRSQKGGTA